MIVLPHVIFYFNVLRVRMEGMISNLKKEVNLLLPRGECKLHLSFPFSEHDKLNENKGHPMENNFSD